MRNIVFLASAQAQKPEILIRTYYDSINKSPQGDILLTNAYEGNVVDFAKKTRLKVLVCTDSLFSNEEWIKNTLMPYSECVLVSCGWPYIIPSALIRTFFAAVNCHGSYLPDYRGSRAYMHYWANCSEYYGATIHYLTDKIDDGNILIRGKLQMFKDESHDSVFIRTAELCGHLLPAAMLMIENSDAGFIAEGQKRYFCKMTSDEFETHRKQNEKLILEGKKPVLTKHKVLK